LLELVRAGRDDDGVDDDRSAVIIAGGSGAVGTAVVKRYVARDIGVIVIDKAPLPTASSSKGVEYLCADVTNDDDIAHAREQVEALGWNVHHVVSLAGGAMEAEFGALIDTSISTIRRSVDLNLTSHVLLTRALVPLLIAPTPGDGEVAGDRSVTLVSSINAVRDYGLPAYSAAKAGMFGFARAMASELGARGIRINVVVPGTVVTDTTQTQPKDFEGLRRGAALRRLAMPDDIAVAVIAASHDLRAMTGQLLVIDCGQTVATPPWRLDLATPDEVARP
jgi:NAD(P)-dependent dehydrogenase (short-subunit alcohol dehydrogenase family)